MTAHLSEFLTDLEAQMTARVTGIKILRGRKAIAEHRVPPAMVSFPISSAFAAAEHTHTRTRGTRHLRSIGTTVGVHLWGADLDAAEAMRDELVLSLFAIAGDTTQTIELGESDWLPEEHHNRGVVVVQMFTVWRPLESPQKTVITGSGVDAAPLAGTPGDGSVPWTTA